jgi:outer membrane protein
MKKTIAIVFAALTVFCGSAVAQQKIGHINSVTILQAMPEFKQMNADVDKQKAEYQKALEAMYSDYEKKQKDLQALSNDKTTPDPIIESKIQELQDLQKRIQDFESKVNDDLQKLQQDKLKPINDKYLKAVKEVAQANGYAYVLDVVSGAVAYYPENADDVTDLVLKKLNITAVPTPTGMPGSAGTTSPFGGK